MKLSGFTRKIGKILLTCFRRSNKIDKRTQSCIFKPAICDFGIGDLHCNAVPFSFIVWVCFFWAVLCLPCAIWSCNRVFTPSLCLCSFRNHNSNEYLFVECLAKSKKGKWWICRIFDWCIRRSLQLWSRRVCNNFDVWYCRGTGNCISYNIWDTSKVSLDWDIVLCFLFDQQITLSKM